MEGVTKLYFVFGVVLVVTNDLKWSTKEMSVDYTTGESKSQRRDKPVKRQDFFLVTY